MLHHQLFCSGDLCKSPEFTVEGWQGWASPFSTSALGLTAGPRQKLCLEQEKKRKRDDFDHEPQGLILGKHCVESLLVMEIVHPSWVQISFVLKSCDKQALFIIFGSSVNWEYASEGLWDFKISNVLCYKRWRWRGNTACFMIDWPYGAFWFCKGKWSFYSERQRVQTLTPRN